MNTICKEHEFSKEDIEKAIEFGTELGNTAGFEEGHDGWIDEMCVRFIETLKPKTDFKIEENIKLIEDNNWDDAVKEFSETPQVKSALSRYFYHNFYLWLRQNYNAPIKKPE